MSKKILLSGVKPTGKVHIANYFGAMKQFVDLSNDYESYIFIADYHALNFIQDKNKMNQEIIDILLDYLAIGLDPNKVTLFKQSDIKEHTELAWIFQTITTMPYLMRAHAFKDAQVKNKKINVGTFNYPMLMSADILLYDSDIVPVGSDQKQHIEIARDTALKFNNIFGETFKLPNAFIIKDMETIKGTDGQKMSKSYNNTIPLFAEYDEIKKCVMSIVTDSNSAIPENVFAIHKLIRNEKELKEIYEKNSGKYKILKEILIEDLEKFISPMRKKRKELEKNIPYILEILKKGGEKAKKIAEEKMKKVKEKIGVDIY